MGRPRIARVATAFALVGVAACAERARPTVPPQQKPPFYDVVWRGDRVAPASPAPSHEDAPPSPAKDATTTPAAKIDTLSDVEVAADARLRETLRLHFADAFHHGQSAADALARVAETSVPALTKILAGPGADRGAAARALWWIVDRTWSDESARVPWADLVAALAERCRDDAAVVRRYCVGALGLAGKHHVGPATAALVAVLRDPDQWMRRRAILALGGGAPTTSAAIPDLERVATSDPWSLLRDDARAALDALQGRPPRPRPPPPRPDPLIEEIARDPSAALDHARAGVRADALDVLTDDLRAARAARSALVRRLDDWSLSNRGRALALLSRIGVEAPADVARVAKLLAGPGDPSDRVHAAYVLGRTPELSPAARAALETALSAERGDVRAAAARMLYLHGRPAGELWPLVLERMERTPDTGGVATRDLFFVMGADAADAVPALERMAVASRGRGEASGALCGIGAPATAAVLRLLDARKGFGLVNAIDLWTFGAAGGDLAAAVPTLLATLDAPDDATVQDACFCLEACRRLPSSAVAPLARVARSRPAVSRVAKEAVFALARTGADAVPTLLELGADDGRVVAVLESLADIGRPAASAAAFALRHAEGDVGRRRAAVEALAAFGVGSPEVLAALRSAAKDADPELAATALAALVRLDDSAAERIVALVAATEADRAGDIVLTLARLGVATPRAVAVYERGLDDRWEKVRIACARALWKATGKRELATATLRDVSLGASASDAREALAALREIAGR